jgi:hypothetical protein
VDRIRRVTSPAFGTAGGCLEPTGSGHDPIRGVANSRPEP